MSNLQEEDNKPIDQEGQSILKVTSQVLSLCSLSPSFIILAIIFMKPSLCKLNCYDYLIIFLWKLWWFEVRIIKFFFVLDWWFSRMEMKFYLRWRKALSWKGWCTLTATAEVWSWTHSVSCLMGVVSVASRLS